MSPVIRFDSVSRRFGRTVALDHLTVDVPAGIVCAVLGANGAGKSTAIRIMLGLEQSDSGTCEVLGMNSQSHALEIRGRVGYVADEPPLYDWMKVGEIGWFTAGFYPTGFQSQYEQLLKRFDLNPDAKISTLSKGMRAKVALSLAMAHQPELLILDEPTSGLDPLVRREFLESMIDVSSEGRTVLLASHQVAEVERVADMVAVLLNGRLVCFEHLDELKRTTTEVVMTLNDADMAPPAIPGAVLAQVPLGHEHIWMVRDLNVEALRQTCDSAALPAPLTRQPSLEDILLAMLREYRGGHRDPTSSSPVAAGISGKSESIEEES